MRTEVEVETKEVAAGVVLKTDQFTIKASPVSHGPISTLAYRIDSDAGSIVISGDTSPCDSLVELAKDVNVLVQDCAFPDHRGEVPGHSIPRQVGVREIYFTLGYEGDQILRFFGDGKRWGFQARYLKARECVTHSLEALRSSVDKPLFMIHGNILFPSYIIPDLISEYKKDPSALCVTALSPLDLVRTNPHVAAQGNSITQIAVYDNAPGLNGCTWSDLKLRAGLQQRTPSPMWVRRMEDEGDLKCVQDPVTSKVLWKATDIKIDASRLNGWIPKTDV